MNLLFTPRGDGYPPEYLLSRIRGRRSRLIGNWAPLVYDAAPLEYLSSGRYEGFVRERTAEGLWRDLLREHRWVYNQMNGALRDAFQSYFFYAELRTVFICLRHLSAGERDKTEAALEASLLADGLKVPLRTGETAGDALAGIGTALSALSGEFRGLSALYDSAGLRAVERQLTNAFLAYAVGREEHPVIRTFFSRMIDARNVLNLYKALKWEAKDESAFLPGGFIPREKFPELLARGDLFSVEALIKRVTGARVVAPEATQVETALYRGITRSLKAGRRGPSGIGQILDYLWRCSLEVMNLSVLLAGKELERETIAAEMV